MKKIFMMAVAAFMATVSANAQFEKGTWSLQPYIGFGVANITNANDLQISADKKLKSEVTGTYLIGGEAEYQFADKFSVAAGVNYTSQGCGWENFNDGETKVKDTRVELGYIKIPMVANFYIFKGFAVKAGVQFGFMVSSKFKFHAESRQYTLGEERDIEADYSVDYKDPFKKFDFSIPVGVSYQFKVPITLDARYQFGLTKLNKESFPGVKDNRNSVFTLTVGYKFAL